MHNIIGYYPKQFTLLNNKAMVLLAPINEEQFNHPFINQVTRAISNQHCLLIELDSYQHLIEQLPSAEMAGLIFHHGRCGSTLLGNMLNQQHQTRVIFEPGAITELLICNTNIENKRRWLNLLVALFSQSNGNKYVFFKLSSLCLYYSDLIQKVLHGIKTIAIYRNPIETMVALCESDKTFPPVSANEQALMAKHLKITAYKIAMLSREEYVARHLQALLQKINTLYGSANTYIINYKTMPTSITKELIPWLNIGTSKTDLEKMREASRYYSKDNKTRVFSSDNTNKRKRVTKAIEQYIDRPLEAYTLLTNLQQTGQK